VQTLDPYWNVKLDQYKRVSGFVGDTCITTSPITKHVPDGDTWIITTKSRHQYQLGRKVRDVEEGMRLRAGDKADVQDSR
jgi:hypothetical protein